MKCPSCSKFAALEMQEPEVNSVEIDIESKTITADVRIVRNSECCGDEMKSYDFTTEADVTEEIAEQMKKIIDNADPDSEAADFEVEEAGLETLEEGGGRYAKSYFGYTLTVKVMCNGNSLGEMEVTDKCAASEMDELN